MSNQAIAICLILYVDTIEIYIIQLYMCDFFSYIMWQI